MRFENKKNDGKEPNQRPAHGCCSLSDGCHFYSHLLISTPSDHIACVHDCAWFGATVRQKCYLIFSSSPHSDSWEQKELAAGPRWSLPLSQFCDLQGKCHFSLWWRDILVHTLFLVWRAYAELAHFLLRLFVWKGWVNLLIQLLMYNSPHTVNYRSLWKALLNMCLA